MSKEQLLIEEYLVESKKQDGKFYLEGIVSIADAKNQNGRVYPEPVLDREMNRFLREHVEKRNAYGHGGHPDHLRLEWDDISHRFISLRKEGKAWYGKAIVSDTPKGRIIKALMEDDGVCGMSSRATGSLKQAKDGTKIVQEDLKMVTFDAVINPSCTEALMTALYEEKEVMYCEDESCYMLVEDINCKIKKAVKKDIESVMLEQFQRYLKHLKL